MPDWIMYLMLGYLCCLVLIIGAMRLFTDDITGLKQEHAWTSVLIAAVVLVIAGIFAVGMSYGIPVAS